MDALLIIMSIIRNNNTVTSYALFSSTKIVFNRTVLIFLMKTKKRKLKGVAK